MRARRMALRQRVSRRVAPISSPRLTQSLAGVAIGGVGIGLPISLFTPNGMVLFYIGIAGLVALFTICGLVIQADFDAAQVTRLTRRAERRAAREATRATGPSPVRASEPDLLEA